MKQSVNCDTQLHPSLLEFTQSVQFEFEEEQIAYNKLRTVLKENGISSACNKYFFDNAFGVRSTTYLMSTTRAKEIAQMAINDYLNILQPNAF